MALIKSRILRHPFTSAGCRRRGQVTTVDTTASGGTYRVWCAWRCLFSAFRQMDPCTTRATGVLTLISGWWDNPTMIVTLDAKRRLTVPVGLAPASPGDYFDARFDAEEDALVFRRLPSKESWFAVLKACPGSPDDVPRRRRAPARRRKL